jgi:hypothetical protein
VDHVALHHRVLPIEPDVEALTHAAAAAVAPREIGATYGLGSARLNVSQDGGDAIGVLATPRGLRSPSPMSGATTAARSTGSIICETLGRHLRLAAAVVLTDVGPPLNLAAIAEPVQFGRRAR